jgi:hypothetical protein
MISRMISRRNLKYPAIHGGDSLLALIVILINNLDKITAMIKKHSDKIMTILTVLFTPIGFIISMIKEIASN